MTIPKIRCPYCEKFMSEYTESFVCCFNEECPYKRSNKKLEGIPGAYYLQWKKVKDE